MASYLDGKTVLVTGGTGYIGSALVRDLLARSVSKVIVFGRDETKQFVMKRRIADSRLETVVGDVRDCQTVRQVFERYGANLVYHAAAMKHVTMCELFPLEALKTNVIGTQNVVDLARRHNVQRLINISTDKAVHATSVLGATKLVAERSVANAGYTSVRFGNVAGSRGSVIPVLIEEMLRHKKLTITDSRVTRFVMTIQDAVNLILKATELATGEDIFILKMKAFRLPDLVDILVNEVAPQLGLDSRTIEVKEIGSVCGEKLHEELVAYEESEIMYELPDMYVLINDEKNASETGAKRVVSHEFTSSNVQYLPRGDLSGIVHSVLEKMRSPEWDSQRFS